MSIIKKILEDYKKSYRNFRSSDNSKDHVEYITLNFIVGKLREEEKNGLKFNDDQGIIINLFSAAHYYEEMMNDLLRINAIEKYKDKKILESVDELKNSIDVCLRYLPQEEFKKFKSRTYEEGPTEDAVGTGFFVDNKGHLITNYHVIKSSNNKAKILFNHEETETNLIAYDELLDLALLKAKVKNKNFIKFSNKSPKKAQSILVAGYPYGKFVSDDLKITSGIINSLKGIRNNTSMLQIDATVNPGNSGGPIVDKMSGNLVGVATMKLAKAFTKEVFGEEGENTNYGIKSSQVRDFLEANNIDVKVKSGKLNIEELEDSTVFIFSKKI